MPETENAAYNFLFAGNSFGDLGQAFLGPDRLTAIPKAAISNPIPYASAAYYVEKGLSKMPVGEGAPIKSLPISHNPGVYNPINVSRPVVRLGALPWLKPLFKGLATFGTGKAVIDAEVYVISAIICKE
jgi:hypothetical protein